MVRTLSLTVGMITVLAITSGRSHAGVILTDPAGYTGPVLDLSPFAGAYMITSGPVSLPGGITFTANPVNPVIPGGSLVADTRSAITSLPTAVLMARQFTSV